MALEPSSKSDANEDVTKYLCAWVNQLSLSDIPDDVRTRAKYLILDGFGCAIVGAHLSWTEKAAEAIFAMESPGNCTVWGYDKVKHSIKYQHELCTDGEHRNSGHSPLHC